MTVNIHKYIYAHTIRQLDRVGNTMIQLLEGNIGAVIFNRSMSIVDCCVLIIVVHDIVTFFKLIDSILEFPPRVLQLVYTTSNMGFPGSFV